MKLSDFDIDFNKFKNEKDSFKFQLKDTFFELKDNSLFDQGEIEVIVQCEKFENTLVLDYLLNGHINSLCERCLNDIKIKVNSVRQDVLKLTLNDDLLKEENYLSINHPIFSVYDPIYEQICLDMPTRIICKNSITQYECKINHPNSHINNAVDERWSELKKLIEK